MLGKDWLQSVDKRVHDYFREKTDNWYIRGIDPGAMDIARKERDRGIDLVNRITSASGLIAEYSNVLMYDPQN